MNNLLDNLEQVRKIDPNNTVSSVESFPDQLTQIWNEIYPLKLPQSLKGKKRIVFSGMGGSALGARCLRSLMLTDSKASFEIFTEYDLPTYVGPDTLVVVGSYSGNTEETLSCYNQARAKKAPTVCLTTGGKLGEEIKAGRCVGHIFTPRYNPLGYPKTGIGYSLGGLLAILANLGYYHCDQAEFEKAVEEMKKTQQTFLLASPTSKNPAKQLVEKLTGQVVSFVASEHLQGAAYTARNQLNEIWHSGSFFIDLPEMNHHLVEAFAKPKSFKEGTTYLCLLSNHYHPRNQLRYDVCVKTWRKMGIKFINYTLKTKSKLAQVLETVNLGGFIAAYGSVFDGEDPGPEPWIIYFKKKLGAPTH